ncbi:sigma 54-interacting transcriptional regulator [Mucilaginibacter sp. X5P1]|uniref:sigma 54-interacting transcriptional regulator n=1 Tax=Mucilaginibacter sp. X5P1 TaxID=2723088 RepID=UPI0016115AF0|nr:sigma 54-interacting transcriptional regulator [Mucilaginibacter sp. X5P1]MBB6139886.1 DNA-binding NtrC family response regulator [Mucilaginibacter sp. X5P1]
MHLVLSQAVSEDLHLEHLLTGLKRLFPEHEDKIQGRYMSVDDVIDISQIKTKVETLLLEFRDHDIDIYFSPGTSAMQVAWYICHTTLNLRTRLLQVRPAHKSKTKKPELLKIDVSYSTAPVSAVIREDLMQQPGTSKADHLLLPIIQRVYEKADKIAQTDRVTTLITGGSGTGKEQLARHIHDRSARAAKSFLPVNCSAFSDQLLEARLFGYKKGAFTGADKESKGLFEAALGGTVFLDEIGDISPYMQQSLLRVLQQQEVLPLGSNEPVKTNVRIVAATNKNLPEACDQGKFRWDLYYRLTIAELLLPDLAVVPQNEREALIDHFLKIKRSALRKEKKLTLTKAAWAALLAYPFPGNIRELENLIEQLYVFHDSQVDTIDLPERIRKPRAAHSLKWTDVEKLHIEKVMQLANGNKSQALKWLGYGSINTLQTKLRNYGMATEDQ